MKRIISGGAVLLAAFIATPAAAQNREHQQMAAELRMLQEQTQQLSIVLVQLGEAIKSVNARIDEVNAVTRKGFADQRLVIDGMGNDMRVIRERVDDTNVRIGTLREEIDALRTSIPAGAAPGGVVDPLTGGAVGSPTPSTSGMSPTRLYETAWADYGAGQYSLAITGFQTFRKEFPRSELADDALFYIGESHSQSKQFADAASAYNAVIQSYAGDCQAARSESRPVCNQVPNAYYKLGRAQEALGQIDAARASYEAVIKAFPDTDGGRLARMSLDRIGSQPATPRRP